MTSTKDGWGKDSVLGRSVGATGALEDVLRDGRARAIRNELCRRLSLVFDLPATQSALKISGVWGFKSPEQWQALPFWRDILGDRLRYVHVVRDGHDVVLGNQQGQYWKYCAAACSCVVLRCRSQRHSLWLQPPPALTAGYANHVCRQVCGRGHHDENNRNGISERMEVWARLNALALDYLESQASIKYRVVRIEDLTLGPVTNRTEVGAVVSDVSFWSNFVCSNRGTRRRPLLT